MASNYELWMDILDFSCILGYPHQYVIEDEGNAIFPLFQQYKYDAATHVWAFLQFLQANNIVHEDLRMKFFLVSLHLEGNLTIRNWYEEFPHKSLYSLRQLVESFSMDWDYDIEEHERKAMIDRMWEETMGNNQAQDGSSEGIEDDIPFEFKDPGNPTVAKMEVYFASLDISKFLGYLDGLPHELWNLLSSECTPSVDIF